MSIIKCHMCKLDQNTCEHICIETEDVKTLYKEGMTEQDAFPKGFCTAHKCDHNPTGFRCVLEKCAFGLDDVKLNLKE